MNFTISICLYFVKIVHSDLLCCFLHFWGTPLTEPKLSSTFTIAEFTYYLDLKCELIEQYVLDIILFLGCAMGCI